MVNTREGLMKEEYSTGYSIVLVTILWFHSNIFIILTSKIVRFHYKVFILQTIILEIIFRKRKKNAFQNGTNPSKFWLLYAIVVLLSGVYLFFVLIQLNYIVWFA